MNSNEHYTDLKRHRDEAWKKVLDKKLSLDDFVYASFNYLQQQRYKPFVKAHDRESILFNYLYWIIHIERKILIEKKLIEMNLGSEEMLNKVLIIHTKRRDQMVRRLLTESGEKVKKAYLVFKDTVEIVLESNEIVYSSLENLEKANITVAEQSKSAQNYYLQLIKS